MSVSSRFYCTNKKRSSVTSGNGSDMNRKDYRKDYDADKVMVEEDLEEHEEDVPYSSSSVDVDRSSIGSIPWADDAIKKNQLDWEAIERMLSGEEAPPANEPELQNEIAEWQRKFPQLMSTNEHPLVDGGVVADRGLTISGNPLDDSLDIDSISNLSLNSVEDDGEEEYRPSGVRRPSESSPKLETTTPFSQFHRLTSLLNNNLRIRSVPLTLRARQQIPPPPPLRRTTPFKEDDDDEDDYLMAAGTQVLPTPPLRHHYTPTNLLIAAPTVHIPPPPAPGSNTRHMRMPPILNVLETTRRFRGGLTNSHRSFVQLTQIDQQQQEAKSAANHANGSGRRMAHSAWQAPLAATKVSKSFLNQRNAIILPAINMDRIEARNHHHLATTTTTETTSEGGARNASRSFSNSSLSSSGGAGVRRPQNFLLPQRNFNGVTTTTTTSNGTPSSTTGRSISAAVIHPHRMQFNAFYLPYSASKFKAFK